MHPRLAVGVELDQVAVSPDSGVLLEVRGMEGVAVVFEEAERSRWKGLRHTS